MKELTDLWRLIPDRKGAQNFMIYQEPFVNTEISGIYIDIHSIDNNDYGILFW